LEVAAMDKVMVLVAVTSSVLSATLNLGCARVDSAALELK